MASEMDPRKKHILKVITDDYIASAEPVGSRTIARRYSLGLSPATIRNEMADLEESGYLEQPHTSAGRVPSEQGYRYYVDALMSLYQMTDLEIERIHFELDQRHQEIETVIHKTARILADMTQYPSLVLGPQLQTAIFRHIQLVKLEETTVLVLIVTDTGYVENKVITLDREISATELDALSGLLNQKLRGVCLRDLHATLLNDIRAEMVDRDHFFQETMKLLTKAISNRANERIFVDGATKILEQPEFNELHKFKPLLSLLEEEDRLYKLLTRQFSREAQVKIGRENQELGINDCSVVTAGYEIGGRTVGVIGVLGPTRMDYAKVMPIVEYTAAILSEFLTNFNKRHR